MKNKNLHLVTLGFSLFKEKFLAFVNPPEAAPAQAAETKEHDKKEKQFFEKLNAVMMSGTALTFDPDKYPYASEMATFVDKLPDLSAITFKSPEKKDGKLILKYADAAGAEQTLTIEGPVYKAIFWKEINAKLESSMFNGKGISAALLLVGIDHADKAPKYNELVDKLAKAGDLIASVPDNDPLVALALKELESLKQFLNIDGSRKRIMARSEVALSQLKQETEDPALTRVLAGKRPEGETGLAEFMEKEKTKALDQLTTRLDEWKLAILRREYKINADKWDPKSREGLGIIFKDFKTLGIYTDNKFFQTMFSELGKCSDSVFLARTDIPDAKKAIYRDPLGNLDKLDSLGDEGFASSVRSLVAFKDLVTAQDLAEVDTRNNVDANGREPITDKVGKFVKDNVHKFTEAIRTHDWATAAIYVGGIYMLWKAWDKWSKDENGNSRFPNASKWLFLAGGLYYANIFAKNAGYDLMKKLGLKDMDAEVKGTPLSVFYSLAPDEMNGVDAGTVAAMSFVNVKDLYEKYEETNDPSIQFMDPARFPVQFPQFRGMSPSLLKKDKLSDKERDYKKAGHELYLFVQGMKKSYDKTLYQKSHIPFEKALRDNVLKASTVFDLAVALKSFDVIDDDKSVLERGGKAFEDMDARMDDVFKGKNLALHLEGTPDEKGGFSGSLMDYPVIFLINKKTKTYYIFAKKDYEDAKKQPHYTQALGTIPFEGNASGAVTSLEGAITGRMKKLVEVFADNDKSVVKIRSINYNAAKGFWEAEMDYGKSNIAKASTSPVKVRVQAVNDGSAVEVTDPTTGRIIIHVNDVTDTAALEQSVAMAELSIQAGTPGGAPDLRILGWFYRRQKMSIVDRDKSDNEFELKIGSMSDLIKMKFDAATGTYSFVNAADEKKIIESSSFKTEIGELVVEDRAFNQPFEESKAILKRINPEYFKHFLKNVSQWASNVTLGNLTRGIRLEHLTGSVSQNYVIGLIDAQKTLVASKIMHSLGKSSDLSSASASIETISGKAVSDARAFADKFAKLNREMNDNGDDWSKVEFDKQVMEPLMEVGTESRTYRGWYKKFVGETFFKYGNDSLRKGNAINASTVVGVFAFYTSAVDSLEIDGDLEDVNAAEIAKAEADYKAADADFRKNPTDKAKEAKVTSTKYFLDRLLAKKRKYQDYYLASHYVEYVANRINDVLDIKGDPDNVQGPGFAYWGIIDFKTFREDPLSLIASTPQKFIDRRPPIKTSNSPYYKEFETDGSTGNAGLVPDRILARDPQIPSSLPVSTSGGVDTNSAEFKRWVEACNRMTEMEKMFKERLYDRINKMITIDADRYNPKFREDVLKEWALTITTRAVFMVDATGKPIQLRTFASPDFKGWIGSKPPGEYKVGTSQLHKSVALIEAEIKANPVTVTRDTQEKLINNAVDGLIEDQIIMNPKKDVDGNPIYYSDITWWQRTKANLKDFWDKF